MNRVIDPLPTRNVLTVEKMVDQTINRAAGLPGFGVYAGPSGYGKTCAATWAAQNHNAIYVEVGASWSKLTLLEKIADEIVGGKPRGTLPVLQDKIINGLMPYGGERPLMIDEADLLMYGRRIELIREIHDRTGCPIILLGEEGFPAALGAIERVANRVYRQELAQPADAGDVSMCAKAYAPGIAIADDLIERVVASCDGRIRRACVSLSKIHEFCQANGLTSIDAAGYDADNLFTQAPPRRARRVA